MAVGEQPGGRNSQRFLQVVANVAGGPVSFPGRLGGNSQISGFPSPGAEQLQPAAWLRYERNGSFSQQENAVHWRR
ncbi:hypothetical protein [Hymenobacter sp. APR13]|uniref:hypothetical protein n=1 Tax=Hymenobacter sp. APR13 TaxID=1356852 RepID=UPI0012E03396|nr:hypothetical protein [Hymenobacter sp. APR13]